MWADALLWWQRAIAPELERNAPGVCNHVRVYLQRSQLATPPFPVNFVLFFFGVDIRRKWNFMTLGTDLLTGLFYTFSFSACP